MVHLADLDITKPDGATEPVAILDNYQREAKEATKTTVGIEHYLTGEHKFPTGNTSSRPAPGHANRLYNNTELKTIQSDDGVAWANLIHYFQRLKIGTYVGDGTGNKPITGVGFGPTGLFIFPTTGNNASYFKSIDFAAGVSYRIDNGQSDAAGIDTLDSDGFTVDASANVNTVVYAYVAVRDRA